MPTESPIVTETLTDSDPLLGGVVGELPAIEPAAPAHEEDDDLQSPVAQDFDFDDDVIRVSLHVAAFKSPFRVWPSG